MISHRTLFALVLACACLVPGARANAQQTESRIIGYVLDASKAALPGATVTITSKQSGAVRTTVAGNDGAFVVTNLAPGSYTVDVELAGFAPQKRDVVLGIAQVGSVDIGLAIASLQEAVTVSGAAASDIELSSAKIGVNVSPAEIEQLPVNGRNFANLMTLATGATSDGNGGWACSMA